MTATAPQTTSNEQQPQTNWFVAPIIAFAVVILAVLAGIIGIAISVTAGGSLATTVEVIRNLIVILLALVLLLIGAAITVVLVQIARFANLVQNEVRPIIESSTDTVNAIRGTATFLSEHAVEPVMQMNAMIAGARQAMDLVRDLSSLRDLATAAAAGGSRGSSTPPGTSEESTD